ncbi:MAG: hypothetical protein ACYTKD_24210 [Planctomycetota bacterium]|jgi:hypothetical protein
MKIDARLVKAVAMLVWFSSAGAGATAAASSGELSVSIVRGQLAVRGEVRGGTAYLGCTITDSQGDEHYASPKNVSGRFRQSFSGWHANQEWDWVVALWEKKVYKRACKNGPRGKPCEWCEKSGYHLENRLDRRSGQYTPPKTLVKHIEWLKGALATKTRQIRSAFGSSARRIRSSKKDASTRRKLAASIKASLDTIKDEIEETSRKTARILREQFEASAEERQEIRDNLRKIAWLGGKIAQATTKAQTAAGKGPAAWLEFADWLSNQDTEPPE